MILEIKTPIWKTRSFGIADFRLQGTGFVIVKCGYTDKSGDRPYPHIYQITKEKALTFPVIKMGQHQGREIPVGEFDELI